MFIVVVCSSSFEIQFYFCWVSIVLCFSIVTHFNRESTKKAEKKIKLFFHFMFCSVFTIIAANTHLENDLWWIWKAAKRCQNEIKIKIIEWVLKIKKKSCFFFAIFSMIGVHSIVTSISRTYQTLKYMQFCTFVYSLICKMCIIAL